MARGAELSLGNRTPPEPAKLALFTHWTGAYTLSATGTS